MILAHRVALNGTQLDSLDSRIIIKAIEEGAGKETISTTPTAGNSGQRVTTRRRESLDVNVKFSLNEDVMATRSTLLETINKWAADGGVLTVGHRTGRELNVICVQCPGAGDVYEWTTVYTITFRAYEVPYWQESTGVSGSNSSASSGSLSLTVGGNTRTVAEITFKNTSGSDCDTFTVSTGDSSISFTSLGLKQNEILSIDHVGKLIRIRIKNTSGTYRSAMGKRTAASSDDLYIKPGSKTVTYSAQRAGNFAVTIKGRFA